MISRSGCELTQSGDCRDHPPYPGNRILAGVSNLEPSHLERLSLPSMSNSQRSSLDYTPSKVALRFLQLHRSQHIRERETVFNQLLGSSIISVLTLASETPMLMHGRGLISRRAQPLQHGHTNRSWHAAIDQPDPITISTYVYIHCLMDHLSCRDTVSQTATTPRLLPKLCRASLSRPTPNRISASALLCYSKLK